MQALNLDAIKTLDPTAAFSINETAKLLSLTHSGVSSRIKKGLLKAGKNGGRYYILGSEIQKQIVLPNETDNL